MSKLEELIEELCPDGVEYKTLVEIAHIVRGVRVVKSQLTVEGKYPVYQNSMTPLGYYKESNCPANTAFIISAGAAGEIGYSLVNFWAADDCLYFVCPQNLQSRYLYHVLLSRQTYIFSRVRRASVPRLARSVVENLRIPVPPLAVQNEIVRILDSFSEAIAELTAELTLEIIARKKQYEYYCKKAFEFSNNDIKVIKLGEIADIGTGSSNTNEQLEIGDYPFFVRSQEVRRKNEYEYDETAIITSGDGVGVGKIFHFVEGKYALHQRAYRIHITDAQVMAKYIFYYMKDNFHEYIQKNAMNSSVTSIRRPMMNNYNIPIPTSKVQQRIVDIFDRFDSLFNDISTGISVEIKARRKQYEYYRDKLLTFKELL